MTVFRDADSDEAPAIPIRVLSSEPAGVGSSAYVLRGELGNVGSNDLVALKVFTTHTTEIHHEVGIKLELAPS